jgi:hypothetical protein
VQQRECYFFAGSSWLVDVAAPHYLALDLPHRCCNPRTHPAVVEALLRLFIAAPPVPLSLKIFHYMPTDTRSVLKIVRTAAASVLWLPYQAYTLLLRPARPATADASGGAAAAPSNSPLGDSALLLLLALLFHAPPPDASFGNPYRQSLQRMQDADDLGGWKEKNKERKNPAVWDIC